jgi:hypothetical protein
MSAITKTSAALQTPKLTVTAEVQSDIIIPVRVFDRRLFQRYYYADMDVTNFYLISAGYTEIDI